MVCKGFAYFKNAKCGLMDNLDLKNAKSNYSADQYDLYKMNLKCKFG